MAYTFKQNLVASSKYSIKCGYSMTPKFVVVHNTYNDAPAKNEVSYMIGNANQTSFHIAVDDIEAIQGIPFNRNAWACGDGANGQGNRYGISVEICYSKSGGAKYTQAEENAVYVCARLLHQHGLGISALKKHQDFSGKYCPHRILDEGRWNSFKDRVRWVLDEIKNGNINSDLKSGTTGLDKLAQPSQPSQPSTSVSTNIKVGDKVKVKTTATHYAPTDGSAQGKSIASFVKGSTYTVTRINGNKLLLSDIVSWVWDFDVENLSATPTSYRVRVVNCSTLNARSGAGTNHPVKETVKVGTILTIVGESNGWLNTKSGLWISKAYTEKC